MSLTEKSIQVQSLEWFYREAEAVSDKPPVLLLHGIPAQSYTWLEIMPDLAANGFRAIAPDWLGFGLSAKPDRRDFAYTPEAYIEALGKLIQTLELEKFSLVVQGFLASVGLQYTLTYPEQIHRLIILNTPIATDAQLPWQMKQWGIPFVGDMLTQDPLLVDRSLEKGSGFVISDENLDVYRRPFLKTSATGRSLIAAIKNLKLPQVTAQIASGLTNIDKQILIIWGMADPWLSSEAAEKLADNQPNIEIVKLEEAKHYPQEHWSQEISPLIVNFLRRQSL